MIVTSLLGLSLVLNISLDVQTRAPLEPQGQPGAWTQLSVQRKETALLPLVRQATDCILRKASADPRFNVSTRPAEISDLIIDSMAACALPVRIMMQAHDRMYGDGSGEAFLLGPYLDVLPSALVKQVKVKFK